MKFECFKCREIKPWSKGIIEQEIWGSAISLRKETNLKIYCEKCYKEENETN